MTNRLDFWPSGLHSSYHLISKMPIYLYYDVTSKQVLWGIHKYLQPRINSIKTLRFWVLPSFSNHSAKPPCTGHCANFKALNVCCCCSSCASVCGSSLIATDMPSDPEACTFNLLLWFCHVTGDPLQDRKLMSDQQVARLTEDCRQRLEVAVGAKSGGAALWHSMIHVAERCMWPPLVHHP